MVYFTMSARLRRNASTIRVLSKASPSLSKKILHEANKDLIDAICECTYNVLRGRVSLSRTDKKKLSYHKDALRKLIRKGVSQKQKKHLIQKGGFLGFLLKPIVRILGGLFT
jgi:hypothetical protein